MLKLLPANEGPKEASSKLRALDSVHLSINNDHGATTSKYSAALIVVKTI
jgi:hypothetical protein